MKLILKGSAGQGVQLMSYVLANVLKDKGFHVSLIGEYSPLMRTGSSLARLVFSREKIDNPIIEDADIEYDLAAEEFRDIKVPNMYLIGVILKTLNLELNADIRKYLPNKFVEENLEALKAGYEREG